MQKAIGTTVVGCPLAWLIKSTTTYQVLGNLGRD